MEEAHAHPQRRRLAWGLRLISVHPEPETPRSKGVAALKCEFPKSERMRGAPSFTASTHCAK